MNSETPELRALVPLAYHAAVVDYLRQHESDVWRWASDQDTRAEQLDTLRASLLRETYRIDAEAHADVHATLRLAMERLGMSALPTTLYQSAGQGMNAWLVFVPNEIHIVLQGPVLERLSQPELLALFGHELSHHLLWSRDGGCYLTADRILHEASHGRAACDSHRETYRRYVLHTELYADRGGAIATTDAAPAIATLVKVQTGIGTVDPEAYLRQAAEIERSETSASDAHSHPETFIRARALSLWWSGESDLDRWIDTRLHGALALERLDLPGQLRLQGLTRGFIAHFLQGTELASPAVHAQIRTMFPDWRDDEPAADITTLAGSEFEDGIRAYFNALMIDLALADPDQSEAALLRAGQVASALGSIEALFINLRRDAGFGKRELDRYKRQLAKETTA